MKVVILCGGQGTRLAEETRILPKPLVAIGDKPILWHIMNHYASFGVNDSVCALGYLGHMIKDYFFKFSSLNSDFSINLKSGQTRLHSSPQKDWNVSLIDTGAETLTGGRLLRLKDFLSTDTDFCLTYGDGLSDVNIKTLIEFHRKHGKVATVTAVRPSARFGEMKIDEGKVTEFAEKPQASQGWINGGFFVFNKKIFDYIDNDQTMLEHDPMQRLTSDSQLMAYKHEGFWQCMDTLRDKNYLNSLWESGAAPWRA